MTVILKPYILMLSLLCSLLAGMVTAGSNVDDNGITLDEAVSKIRAQISGRILSAKTVSDNSERTHRIRVLTKDGRVQRFQIQARHKKRKSSKKRQR